MADLEGGGGVFTDYAKFLQIFLKAFWAPIFTIHEFWSKLSKNCLKRLFLACFFFKFLAAQKLWRNRVFLVLWESSENQLGQTKKKVDNIFESF